MNETTEKREPTGTSRLLIDIGPLLVFFLVNFFAPVPGALKVFVATGALGSYTTVSSFSGPDPSR